jgi:hypothetical protein
LRSQLIGPGPYWDRPGRGPYRGRYYEDRAYDGRLF